MRFTVRGLDAGSYILTFNPCPYGNGLNHSASKSNAVTRFVIDNPGVKSISVELSHITCAGSEVMPLRASRTPQRSLKVIGALPPEVFAAGIDVEVERHCERNDHGRMRMGHDRPTQAVERMETANSAVPPLTF